MPTRSSLDEFGYAPRAILAPPTGPVSSTRSSPAATNVRGIIFTTNIEVQQMGTIFADDKLAAAIIDRIVHHGRLIEFTGPSRRVNQALMFGKTDNQ